MTTIGRCTFEQLPEKYQHLFETGANFVENGRFIPGKNAIAYFLISIPFYALFAIIPPMFILDLDLKIVSPLGILSLLPLLVLIGLVIRASSLMLELRQKEQKGIQMYGLVIDEKNIVLRLINPFERKNCVYMPRDRLVSSYTKRHAGRPVNKKPDAYRLQYLDDQGDYQWMTLVGNNDLELNLFRIDDLFMALHKSDISGEWSYAQPKYTTPPYDSVIHFHEPNGKVVEWFDGEKTGEMHFTFEQVGERAIDIKTADSGDSQFGKLLIPGLYTFTIKVQLNTKLDTGKVDRYYFLRFDQPFFESPYRNYGQVVAKQ